jgi:3-dehydroquinate dehydratase-1
MRQRKRRLDFGHCNVVGVVQTPAGFDTAGRLEAGTLDAVEARLDLLGSVPAVLSEDYSLPVIATARHPAERGGRGDPAAAGRRRGDRRRLLEEAMPIAAAIDIELRSAGAMRSVLDEARRMGVARILSFHDFERTPSLNRLVEMMRRARDEGADVFKVAATARGPKDIAILLELLDRARLPLAVMAMGRYGKASRLALGACGSALNYGWIERPVASGQWSATELHERLTEVGAR